MIAKKIKVLCVDDSALMRNLLTGIINAQPDMQVVATASDPLIARDLIKRHDPDVLTLDINMPRMDGLVFLTHLMRLRPMPVLMVSSLTRKNSKASLKALGIGMSGTGIDNTLKEIEILPGSSGKPLLSFSGWTEKISRKKGIKQFTVSISHSENYAVATVILTGRDTV